MTIGGITVSTVMGVFSSAVIALRAVLSQIFLNHAVRKVFDVHSWSGWVVGCWTRMGRFNARCRGAEQPRPRLRLLKMERVSYRSSLEIRKRWTA